MGRDPLSYELLLERSRKLQMPFSNLLGGAVLEEIVNRIGLMEQGERFWLRNGTVLGEKQYAKKLILSLEYDYAVESPKREDEQQTDESIFHKLSEKLSEEVWSEKRKQGFVFRQKKKMTKRYLLLQVTAEFEEMQVPVSVKIYLQREDKRIPKKETFSSVLFPEEKISYNSCPAEGILAEKYLEIITKLELIQNIGDYYDIYHLLERESVDGRKVKEYIEEQCKGKRLSKEENRIELIAGYKNYSYMKKKWKAFLRSVPAKEPSWEAAVERFLKFFEPIWRAVTEDLVFFGDWMPELNRFL